MHFLTEVAAFLFAAFGAGLCGWFAWALPTSVRSRAWPITSGIVVASAVEAQQSEGALLYRAAVSYKYVVNSSDLISSRVTFGDFLSSMYARAAAERRKQKYPIGAEVAVSYDPECPEEAVLEPGPNRALFTVGALGVILVTAGYYAFQL